MLFFFFIPPASLLTCLFLYANLLALWRCEMLLEMGQLHVYVAA